MAATLAPVRGDCKGATMTANHHVEDFLPVLRDCIEEARTAGLASLADELESRALAAYTTSSELLGEVGQAIVAFLHAAGPSVPYAVANRLRACLAQVQGVWPNLRA
jgi:hypothetical protein